MVVRADGWRALGQIRDEGQAARIHCPGELVLDCGKRGKCTILVDEAVVEKLLESGPDGNAALLSKYRKRIVEGYAPIRPTARRTCLKALMGCGCGGLLSRGSGLPSV